MLHFYILLLCMMKNLLNIKWKVFAFKPYMKNVYVEMFINQIINQNGIECAILKIMYYKPFDLIF